MGGWFSSESTENKRVESDGVINNTFIMNDMLQIHNNEMVILLGIIAACQIIQLAIYLYTQKKKAIKKEERSKIFVTSSSNA